MKIKSKVKPTFEFIASDSRPGMVGVKNIRHRPTAWWKEASIKNYIKKLQKDVDFYQELYEVFERIGG